MTIMDRIRTLHQKHRASLELEDGPIPSFQSDDLAKLEVAVGRPLPEELREILKNPGVFAPAPEVYIEDVGYFCVGSPETMIEDAMNLQAAASKHGWQLPSCCVLSLVSNTFIAYDFDNKTVISIDGDDGEVTELAFDLEGLYRHYADLWEASLAA
jgi:hypothetical protein